jgi:phosphatidylglycerophosphate synthase
MAACSEPEESRSLASGVFRRSRKARAGRELLVDLVFRPIAHVVVLGLTPLRVSPPLVVAANAAAGFVAAVALAEGELVAAALLLQLKTVLDNADGQLARATGRMSVLGRYLDTEADLAVNIMVFAALAYATGSPLLAVAGLAALTLVLSAAFNEDVLYRRARGEQVETQPSAEGEGVLAQALADVYRLIFAPQDRALQGLAGRRLGRILAGVDDPGRRERAALAYHDDLTSTVLANLGLSTQLAVLGVCLAIGSPTAYLWIVLACAAVLLLLQLRRELRARRLVRAA